MDRLVLRGQIMRRAPTTLCGVRFDFKTVYATASMCQLAGHPEQHDIAAMQGRI